MHSPLADVLSRARAVILGNVSAAPLSASQQPAAPRPAPVVPVSDWRPTTRPTEPPAPRVLERVTFAALESLCALPSLKEGPRRLLELLHRLAVEIAQQRGHSAAASQIVLHQSQELLARALGVHRITVWKWTRELELLGMVQSRAHKSSTFHRGERVTRNDGTLYAVSLKAGHRARVRHDDLKHRYRDLDSDRREGKTAYQTGQQSQNLKEGEWFGILRQWAVLPGSTGQTPVESSDCCPPLGTVQSVIHALPLLRDAHRAHRPDMVSRMGAALARALNDLHSVRWYCLLIWEAIRADWEGRNGLQGLAAQLARLDADRAEWAELRNPAALLTARLARP